MNGECFNVGSLLRETAQRDPLGCGVVVPAGRGRLLSGKDSSLSFAQLEALSNNLAAGLVRMGAAPGARLVLAVRPGIEFVALTFAIFKMGGVVVLIDPGMGARQAVKCLEQARPEGFLGPGLIQWLRLANRKRFPAARFNVRVGGHVWGPGISYRALAWDVRPQAEFSLAKTRSTDPAAIIFTSGSTGPAKGVVYEHGMFRAQANLLREYYGIEPGEIDMPAFPLFGLFNAAMGVTTVIPPLNPARPARANPRLLVNTMISQRVTQSFGSPAIWSRVADFCLARRLTLPRLKRVFSAGAPVPIDLVERMTRVLDGDGSRLHTPYGATEALPVSSTTARHVLGRTAAKTRGGAGTYVGRPFPQVHVKIIARVDGPIASLSQAREMRAGQIGEIIVRGNSVTRMYAHMPEATREAKIADGLDFWHRMGDVGYLDEEGGLWYCGRKAHIVETEAGPMFTDCVEPIFNEHPRVRRTALVGVGQPPRMRPVIVVELQSGGWSAALERELLELGQARDTTRSITTFLHHRAPLPVDRRHNIKIHREQLAAWAVGRLRPEPTRGAAT